jgi:hypothetical protein
VRELQKMFELPKGNGPQNFHLRLACRLIERAEKDLRHKLTDGERRDLLMDNTEWDSAFVAQVVANVGSVR